MRTFFCFSLLAAIAFTGPALADPLVEDDSGTFKSDELNFEIKAPEDSVDWEFKKIDPKTHPQLRVYFFSEFADSNAWASVQVNAQKLSKQAARNKLSKIAGEWKDAMESDLSNPRERTEKTEQFAGVESYFASVQGDKMTGIHLRTWRIFRNGQMLYSIVVDRHLDAVKDEDVADEVAAILKSFKFGEIRKVKADRKAKDGGAPEGPEGGGKGGKDGGPKGDPKLLKKAPVTSAFWRYKCVKPSNTLAQEIDENSAANAIKNFWQGEITNVRFGVRIYAWSLKKKKYTIDQLVKAKLDWWKTRVKQTKKPIRKDKYKKIPLTKKGTYLELVGRSIVTERWIYIFLECKNDRMYQIEIYSMGDTGNKLWGKSIDAFIKSFKPQKK